MSESLGATRTRTTAFGAALRSMRLAAGLSQGALAERAGLSEKAVGALERGDRTTPRPATVALLADALGASPAERDRLLGAAHAEERTTDSQRPTATDAASLAQHGLLVPPTSLLGRQHDIAAVAQLVSPSGGAARLLTLIGPGGVGKTRLACAAATRLAADFPESIAFVDLAPLRDARLVPATIARALDIRESGGRSARELLLEYLSERRVLLVLDNFEHLLEAAPVIADLVSRCPRLAALVTSRAALRVQGERRFLVAPLAIPSPKADPAERDIGASPAVRLFVERVQAVAPDFGLDGTNASAVAAICRRLDGLPLAIELAAARAGLLGPEALLGRLEHRLPLLTGGAVDLPERQRTLRATLAWSYDLLEPAEQVLFRRLAVFAGGWTLEAAEAVCADAALLPDRVLDALQGLVNSSLVRHIEGDGSGPRFGMLETLRDYAEEQLSASGEADASFRRLRDWAVALVERVALERLDPAHAARLDREQNNLRVALRWTIQQADVEAALRLGVGMWLLWYMRGRYAEGRAWLAEILQLPPDAAQAARRGRALAFAGQLATVEGDLVAAEALLCDAQATAEAADDLPGLGLVAQLRGNFALDRGQLVTAEGHYMRALALARQTHSQARQIQSGALLAQARFERGDVAGARALIAEVLAACAVHDLPLARAWVLSLSGRIAAQAGDHANAQHAFEASSQVMRAAGYQQGLAFGHLYLGHAALDRGDRAEASQHFGEVLIVAQATHHEQMLARGLEAVARLLLPTEPLRGRRLIAAASALRTRLGLPLARDDRVGLENWLPESDAAIGSAFGQSPVEVPAIGIVVADAMDACATGAH